MDRESPDFQKEQAKKSRLRRNKNSTPAKIMAQKTIGGALALGRNRLPQVRSKLAGNDEKDRCPAYFPKGRKIRILHLSDFHFSNTVSIENIDLAAKGFGAQTRPHDNHGGLHYRFAHFEGFGQFCGLPSQTHPPSVDLCLPGQPRRRTLTQKRGGYKSPERVKGMLKSANVIFSKNSSKRISPSWTNARSQRPWRLLVGSLPTEGLAPPSFSRGLRGNYHSSVSQSRCKETAEELSMGSHAKRPHSRRDR